MKIISFVFLLLLMCPLANADEYWAPHWSSRLSTINFHATTLGTGKVLLYGDSNTEAFWWTNVSGCTLLNAGLGGARVRQIAEDAAYVANITRPHIVHLMIGTNNLGMDHANPEWSAIYSDIFDTIQAFTAVGAQVVVWPVFPVSSSLSATNPQSDRVAINTAIQSAAVAAGAYWDWWFPQQYEDSAGYAVAGALVADGVHFSRTTHVARYSRMATWHQYIKDATGVGCN